MRCAGRIGAIALAFGVVATQAQPAPTSPPGDVSALLTRSLVATCAACHETEGRAATPTSLPPLAGTSAAALKARMTEFRNGSRAGTVMPQLMQGFSDAQIEQLARWFAAAKLDGH